MYRRTTRRCIPQSPEYPIWYLVDANFIVNRYLKAPTISDKGERFRVLSAQAYWATIDEQLADDQCKVLLLDVCIAEAFKTLAKKYFGKNPSIQSPGEYNRIRKRLRSDITLSSRDASLTRRSIRFHDIQTSRDIIIGVDRFFERQHKLGANVSIVDLLILATAKYLVDFFGFSKDNLFIITQDNELYRLARALQDLPKCFNPSAKQDASNKVYV
jgi:hypothetical protein